MTPWIHTRRGALAGAAALLVLAGCGGEPTTPAPLPSTADAEMVAAQMAGGFFGMSSPLGAIGMMGGTATGIPHGRLDATHAMPPHSGPMGPMSVSHEVRFFDAAGALQPAYDALTTERVVTVSRAEGTISLPSPHGTTPMEVQHSGSTTLSGLAGVETTRRVDGGGTGRVRAVISHPTRGTANIEVATRDSMEALVLPVQAIGTFMRVVPLSGSVQHRRTVTMTSGGQASTATFAQRTTFDGSTTARVTMEINGITRTCTQDLLSFVMRCG